ncbi:peptidoglycan recognition family protein [Lachnospiraceae bacterium 29-84]
MGNSPLISYTKISPNRNSPRNHAIDTITVHCVVGQLSAEEICGCFESPEARASCNYGIGTDGRICLCVEEGDRSWCSSNSANDNRAITIECASDKEEPYAINRKVYDSLVRLCADICKRNGIKKLLWRGDKSLVGQVDKQNMTVHRWFASKSCPGDYIYSRLGQMADEVNQFLRSGDAGKLPDSGESSGKNGSYPTMPFMVDVLVGDLNYRSKPSMDGDVLGATGKGQFTITEVSGSWGKLKSGAGWIFLGNAAYCRIGGTVPNGQPGGAAPYQVKVTVKNLNVRKGPGTATPAIQNCPAGVYTIVEEANGVGAKKWGKLKSGAGWISLDYAVKV